MSRRFEAGGGKARGGEDEVDSPTSARPRLPEMQRSRLALRTCKRALSTTAQPAQSASYQPPVQPGTLPAYDHALAYIQQDRDHKLAQLEELKKRQADQAQLDKLEIEAWSNDPETRWRAKNGHGEHAHSSRGSTGSSRRKALWGTFRGGSEAPELCRREGLPGRDEDSLAGRLTPQGAIEYGRADADNMISPTADFSKPVYRHLAERAWRKDGDLAILVRAVSRPSSSAGDADYEDTRHRCSA